MPLDVTVVLPTYNELENLPPLIEALAPHGYRLLVVDDASPDGTGRLADRLAAGNPLIDVVHRPGKEGLGVAYGEGFGRALEGHPDVVCQMDCDFSHDPDDLPRLVEAVREGADVAIGSRYVPGGSVPDWPLVRRLISRGGNRYARLALGVETRDATSGFRAFTSDALRRLSPETCTAAGYTFQVEMAWRAERLGMRVVEVPISFRDRQRGTSKMDSRVVLEAMRLVTSWGLQRMTGRLPFPK